MSRLIEADALFINLDGMMAVSPTGYIHGDTVADMISDAPTVEAIPVEWIEQYGEANWYDFGTQYNAITKMLEEWKRKEE